MKGRSRRDMTPPHRNKGRNASPNQPAGPPPRPLTEALRQHLHRALEHHQHNRLPEAEAAYRAVLESAPRNADALNLLGVICLQTGRAAEAEQLLTAATQEDASVAAYHDNLGSALAAQGRIGEAAAAHWRAVKLKPDFAAAHFNLANALDAAGRDEAEKAFRAALVLRPDYFKAWFNLGNARERRGRHREAAAAFACAVALEPTQPDAHTNLSDALSATGDLAGALKHQRAAVALRPDDANAHYNLGVVLQQSAKYEEAELAYRGALRRRPDHVGAWNNLGGVLRRLKRPDKAAACHRIALAFRPDFLEAYYNLGNALQRMGKNAEAAAIYLRVLARNPDLATATHNLGMLSLINGDLVRGWEGYEKRFQAKEAQPWRRPPLPRWNGEALNGRRLLVWREQGVGDEILFSSCYPQLAALDGPVTVECEPRLTALFAGAFPKLKFRAQTCTLDGEETLADLGADLHCPAGSLPRLLRRRLGDFSAPNPWLKPNAALAARWRTRVNALGAGLKVGICWRSQLGGDGRDSSYTTLPDWAPLFATPNLRLVNLQYDDCATEIEAAQARFDCIIHRWSDLDLKNDFAATAALIGNLDLVITVATSVGELAAALGTPTWRIGGANDWSSLGTQCRPWYPAMRLWRPEPGESLPSVLSRTAAGLRLLTPAPKASPTAPSKSGAAPAAIPTGPMLRKAIAAQQTGQADLAATLYRRLLAIDPAEADGLHLMGLLRHQTGASDGGEPSIRRALRVDPEFAFAANNLGLVRQARGDSRGAGRAFAHALKLRPDFAEATTHFGVLRQHLNDYDPAARLHRRAIRLNPLSASFRNNLGTVLERAGRFEDAATAYRFAAALDPAGLADTLNNLGMAAQHKADAATAKTWLARALRVDERHGLAAWNLGLLQLTDGDLGAGWAGYERRFAASALQPPRNIRLPVWRGGTLRGRRLLVWGEQGIGDEILFASCLSDLAGLDGQVVLECDHRLTSLFARAFPWAEVRASEGEPGGPERRTPSDCDHQLPIGSLPALTRRRLTDFPQIRRAYLSPRDDLVEIWRKRLDALPSGLKIGLAWTSQVISAYRSPAYMKLTDWLPVLRIPGVIGVNLQYGDTSEELRRLREESGAALQAWPDLDLKNDFESVAALISQLDLVACPASSVGELSAALGVPTWRMCHNDWTHLGTDTRPWFSAMRVVHPPTGDGISTTPQTVARLLLQLRQQLRNSA